MSVATLASAGGPALITQVASIVVAAAVAVAVALWQVSRTFRSFQQGNLESLLLGEYVQGTLGHEVCIEVAEQRFCTTDLQQARRALQDHVQSAHGGRPASQLSREEVTAWTRTLRATNIGAYMALEQLSTSMQRVGLWIRVGALPVEPVMAGHAAAIVFDWHLTQGITADRRDRDGLKSQLAFVSSPLVRTLPAPGDEPVHFQRRHGDLLACLSQLYLDAYWEAPPTFVRLRLEDPMRLIEEATAIVRSDELRRFPSRPSRDIGRYLRKVGRRTKAPIERGGSDGGQQVAEAQVQPVVGPEGGEQQSTH